MHAQTHARTQTHTHAQTQARTQTHTHTHTKTHAHTHAHTNTRTYSNTPARTDTHTHSNTHTQIHTHIHTHTRLTLTLGVRYIDKKKDISIFWGIFSITIIRQYFTECVIVLISDYRGQRQFSIFFIFCVLSSQQWTASTKWIFAEVASEGV